MLKSAPRFARLVAALCLVAAMSFAASSAEAGNFGKGSFGKGNFKALFEAIEREQEKRGNL